MKSFFKLPFTSICGVLCVAIWQFGGAGLARAGEADGRLDIYWIDVEGGAATLIVTPLGESVLIDTGNPGHRDSDRIFKAITRAAGLRKIDNLVITHYHVDHFGGAAALASVLPIGQVYDNGSWEAQRERPDASYLEFKAEKRNVISAGDHIPLKATAGDTSPTVSLKCLCARQQTIAGDSHASANDCCGEAKPRPIDNSDNANSVVLLLAFGPFRFFDAGDLTWNIEKNLVCPTNLIGKVDVYQVTHHGLDNSNNTVLLKTLAPTVAVMNNGAKKGCEPNTFATLKALPSMRGLYQMHRNVRVDESGNTASELIANADEDCQAKFIHLSVDPQGKTYTLAIEGGSKREYQTK